MSTASVRDIVYRGFVGDRYVKREAVLWMKIIEESVKWKDSVESEKVKWTKRSRGP
jgi:hypothetical protein